MDVRHSLTGKDFLAKGELKMIKDVWKVLFQTTLKKLQLFYSSNILPKERIQCVSEEDVLKMKFSELPGASYP